MKKANQQGFTYPLILCLLILFLLFFSMQIEQLLTERKMALETTTILQQEYYFLSSVKKLEEWYLSNGSLPAKGSIKYKNATMNYLAELPIGSLQKVNFTLIVQSRDPVLGYGYFNIDTKKMVKWVEIK